MNHHIANTEKVQETVIMSARHDAEMLIAKAIDKNVSVETMERLLVMRRELKAERAKAEFDKAMSDFQKQCPIIEKTAQAGSGNFAFKYAPLDYIVKQVKSILAENGFSYTFDTKKTDKSITTFCKVKHKDGHMEVSEFDLSIDVSARMNTSQKDGAANTYGKRYAFCNAFGILTGDEDTDAKRATGEHDSRQNHDGQAQPWQIASIRGLLNKKGYTEDDLLRKYRVKHITSLTRTQADLISANLKKLPDIDSEEMGEQIANDAAAYLS